MVFLLGDQTLYFPSSDDQSYPLRTLLKSKFRSESNLPTIVRIKSSKISNNLLKEILNKNTPLLLLDVDQFESLLAEFHPNNDRRFSSNRTRLFFSQGKLRKKILNKKKSNKSLVTFNDIYQCNDQTDDELENTRTVVRSLNENCSSSILCRIPINYRGFFEILNENDQSIEPFHRLSELVERRENENEPKNFNSFFLRTSCSVFTQRKIFNGRNPSASGDSSYGSLSDLDSQKNLCVLNEETENLRGGQILTILNVCSAVKTRKISADEQFFSSSAGRNWFREKSRRIFSKRKIEQNRENENFNKNFFDEKIEKFVKCCTEDGDIVFLPMNLTGVFSPILSEFSSNNELENFDFSSIFHLKQILNNFRFPISVRLIEKTIIFDENFQPLNERSINSIENSTKLRLLLPFSERVVFVCPLVNNSSRKNQPIVVPIPIETEIEIQRCLNMREILEKPLFHEIVHSCLPIIQRYQNQFSLIHFPVVLNFSSLINTKRKNNIFKKRSKSESNLETNFRRSQQILSGSTQFDLNYSFSPTDKFQRNFFRDSFQRNKEKIFHQSNDFNQQQNGARSAFYNKFKNDRNRKSMQNIRADSDDENYRELDQIYDFIRSGDLNDEVKRIQEKEKAFNRAGRPISVHEDQLNSTISYSSLKNFHKPKRPTLTQRFPIHLDDSRPLDSEFDDEKSDSQRISEL